MRTKNNRREVAKEQDWRNGNKPTNNDWATWAPAVKSAEVIREEWTGR